MNKRFKFIDLFSGIGGFHQSMKKFGGECVFSSEIDKHAIEVYENNYKIDSNNNITMILEQDIPVHDVLCAGFPCQAFSKAGKQNGLNDTRGTLFFEIERILKYHKSKIIILENVRNLTTHDEGRTWKVIEENLIELGYRLTEKPLILSPHNFGIPHLRERVFIVGIYDPLNRNKRLTIEFDNLHNKKSNSIETIINDKENYDEYKISSYEEKVLNIWNDFYNGINMKTIGFPIWSEYFTDEIKTNNNYPDWKNNFIQKNQILYSKNKKFIDKWLKKHNYLDDFVPTHRKFEWQAGESISSIWEGIIQFRPSGIRVKRPDVFPSLVAMVQIPIIGRLKRRLSPRECARLQSFPEDFILDTLDQQAYKQLGNSLNVLIVDKIFTKVIDYLKMYKEV